MMGNSSAAPSAPPCVSNCSVSSNLSVEGGSSPFSPSSNFSFLQWFLDWYQTSVTEILSQCHVQGGSPGWLGVKIFLLVTAFPANVALMMTLLSRRRSMTPSELLGLNVSLMDVLYCLCLPLDLYIALKPAPETVQGAQEALFSLNVFGCPLLLTFMCLERYMAAAWPITYIRLGRWEYRAALCTCTWILTLTVALLGYFVGLLSLVLCLSVIISLLFLLMLLSLLGIVWVLRQSGPGEGSGSRDGLKRRALKNIVAVMVPSVVAYSPLVALVPYMAVITAKSSGAISPAQCDVLQVLMLFPNFGLFIGPTFYLSRLRQVSCCAKDRKEPDSKTQTE